MRIKVVLNLLKKEFLNIIRDRKSFICMILLPLLMFPLMIGLLSVVFTMVTTVTEEKITFGVNYEIEDDFKEFINSKETNHEFEIIYDTDENLQESFKNGDLYLYVIKNENNYELHYDQNATNNIATVTEIEMLYKSYEENHFKEELISNNVDYDEIRSHFTVESVQENVTEMGSLIPVIFSMMLTLLITSAAFNVAIEITTSEKEKGTLETLLSLPIRKTELIASKYLTTVIMSIMSGILTYISVFTTIYFSKNALTVFGIQSINIDPKLLIVYLIGIILFSIFLSGLILSLTIFSKSLKEAQNTLAPIEIMMALISYLPMLGYEANIKNAIIPFVNLSLLFNNALSTAVDTTFIILTFLSTCAYALILMIIVTKLYSQEDVLFNSSNLKNMTFAKGKGKMLCFSPIASIALLIIIYLLSFYLSLIFIKSSTTILLLIMPLTIIVTILLSGLIIKLDFKKALKINKFDFKKLVVLIFMIIGLRIIATDVLYGMLKLFPSLNETNSMLESVISLDNIFVELLVVALAPAIAEEILFRGVVQNSFMRKYSPLVGIIASSLLFGIYHMNWLQGVNAFILGLGLGYAYFKTKSIFVPMILHFGNNAFAVLIEKIPRLNIGIPLTAQIILTILAICVVVSGLYLFKKELRN